MKKKTIAISTLGCKVNQYESSAIENLFRQRGYKVVDFNESAGVYLINTCTVTHMADSKSRQLLRKAIRNNPEATVVVSGCYAQTAPEEVLNIPGVDLVVGTSDRHKIVDLVESNFKEGAPVNLVTDVGSASCFEELPTPFDQSRIRGFLKIQEGCENFCTYCIVPYARGPLRSRNPDNVLQEAGELLKQGYKEIVLTGIHIGAYGKETGTFNLAGLVKQISSLKGLKRLRLSSLEPQDVNDELVEVLTTTPKICRHFHLPLQSGDDNILKKMNRRYDTNFYKGIVHQLRKKIPEVAITTDVMTGFPGETNEQFENTARFLKEMRFADIHVFKYSPRRKTAAASFNGQIEAGEKERRKKKLIKIGEELQLNYISKFINEKLTVLAEQYCDTENNLYEGYTDNYVKVFFPVEHTKSGDMVEVQAEKIVENCLYGIIV